MRRKRKVKKALQTNVLRRFMPEDDYKDLIEKYDQHRSYGFQEKITFEQFESIKKMVKDEHDVVEILQYVESLGFSNRHAYRLVNKAAEELAIDTD